MVSCTEPVVVVRGEHRDWDALEAALRRVLYHLGASEDQATRIVAATYGDAMSVRGAHIENLLDYAEGELLLLRHHGWPYR